MELVPAEDPFKRRQAANPDGSAAAARSPAVSDPETDKAVADAKARSASLGQHLSRTLTEDDLEEAPDPFRAPSFGESVGRGVDIAQGMGYGFLEASGEATDIEALTQFGREGRKANMAEAERYPHGKAIDDIKTFGDFGQWMKDTVGEQIPLMAPSVAGATTGGAIGFASPVPGGAAIGTAIGAIVPSFVLGVGETQQAIKEKDPETEAPGWAFAGGSAIAALDSVLPGRVGSQLVRKFGKDAAEEVAQRALWKRVSIEGGKGMATEGLTEALQEAISEVAAAQATGKPVDTESLKTQMKEAAAAGALMGGGVQGAVAVLPDPEPQGDQRREPPPLTEDDLEPAADPFATEPQPEPEVTPEQAPQTAAAPDQRAYDEDLGEFIEPVADEAEEAELQLNNNGIVIDPAGLPGLDTELAATEAEPVEGDGTPESPVQVEDGAEADVAAERVEEPTEKQKESGNYRKGHIKVIGLNVTIETPKGAMRRGVDRDGKEWSVRMPAHYGYAKRTEGADGDHVDLYMGDNAQSPFVFVVDQIDAETGKFDEHKAMVGFATQEEAEAAYDAAFNDGKGPQRRGAVTSMSAPEFRDWLKNGDTKAPIALAPDEAPEQTTDDRASPDATSGPQYDAGFAAGRAGEPMVSPPEYDMPDARAWTDGYIDGMSEASKAEEPQQAAEPAPTEPEQQPSKDAGPYTEDMPSGKSFILKNATDAQMEAVRAALPEKSKPIWNRKFEGWVFSNKHRQKVIQAVISDRGYWEAQRPERAAYIDAAEKQMPAGYGVDYDGRYTLQLTTPDGKGGNAIMDISEWTEPEFRGYVDRLVDEARKRVESEDTPKAEREAAAEARTPQPKAPDTAGEFARPRVIINEVGSDGLTDAERDAKARQAVKDSKETAEGRVPVEDDRERQRREQQVDEDSLAEEAPTWAEILVALPKDDNGRADTDVAFDLMSKVAGRKIERYRDLKNSERIRLIERIREETAAGQTGPEVAADTYGKSNKIFTEDAAEKARRILREKMKGQLSAGLDPEIVQAGITLAGYHIEAGARSFAAYSKAMIDDLGEGVRPYLRSWYEGVRHYPNFDNSGMTPADQIEATNEAESATIPTAEKESASDERVRTPLRDASEGEPAEDVRQPETGGDAARARPERGETGGRDGGEPDAQVSDREAREDAGQVADDGGPQETGARQQRGAAVRGRDRDAGSDTDSARSGRGRQSGDRPDGSLRGQNYRITDADKIGEGGPKAKFQSNLNAIRIVKTLQAENRPATREEQADIVKFVGWGGMPQVFDEKNAKWSAERADLKEVLTDEEWEAARLSTINAHYTSPEVIREMWSGMQALGFEGGKVLEPGMGVGHFLGLSPDANINFTGVELDPLTGMIARALYPDADIRVQRFEETVLPENSFDMAIGNVPFADIKPSDSKYNKARYSLHDYFFWKSLHMLKPGGYMAFITSSFSMDKRSTKFREAVNGMADMVGAIRLPYTAFKGNAGTEVVTDLIVLRKRKDGESPRGAAWKSSAPFTEVEGDTVFVSEYYLQNPKQVMGKITGTSTMYGRGGMNVEPDTSRPLSEQIADAFQRIKDAADAEGMAFKPEANASPAKREGGEKHDTLTGGAVPSELDEGSLFVDDGVIYAKEYGVGQPAKVAQKNRDRAKRLIKLRDVARDVLRLQGQEWDGEGTGPWADAQKALNREYDAFVKKYGPINKHQTRRGVATKRDGTKNEYFYNQYVNLTDFGGDPGVSLLRALEYYSEDTGKAEKAPIFNTRVVSPQRTIKSVETLDEALIASLNEKGAVDLDYMSGLIKRDREQIITDLKGRIFKNPANGKWETSDQYLSGNVRDKLALARKFATDPTFADNIAALEDVQPEDLAPGEIGARLGSSWIPADDVQDFVRSVLDDSRAEITHIPSEAIWRVTPGGRRNSVAATQEWGTDRRDAYTLIEDALNQKTSEVYDNHSDGTRTKNADETVKAQEAQSKLRERFTDWIWEDEARAERLARKYNDEFNNIVPRSYDGAHLTLPGSSNVIELRPHQKDAVWRTMQAGNSLYAHVVGAGKTFTSIAAGMEMKRIGAINKPAYVVPNHMLEQFSREFLQLYPSANLLVADKANFSSAAKRRHFVAKAATGDWDAVIIKHSSFEKIPVRPSFEADFMRAEIEEYERLIREAREVAGKNAPSVKELEKAKERRKDRLKTLLKKEKKDTGTFFEETGIDYLFVDEFHLFKNLEFPTKMRGVTKSASQRAQDMFLKIQYLEQGNPGRTITAMTATPISNSVAEMFTMQRYLQLPMLKQRGVAHFDAWASTFGETVTAFELSPDGGSYRMNTRFAKFVNVPELTQMFAEVADVRTAKDLNLPTPNIAGGAPQTVVVEGTDELLSYVAELAERAERVRSRQVEPEEDNMLKITGDGRRAALDMRLVEFGADVNEDDTKLASAATRIKDIYDRTADNVYTDPDTGHADERKGALQLVFLDLSTPTKDGSFSVYNALRERLIDSGIPAGEIAFIHDYPTDDKKARLFEDARNGTIRVLLGSTAKMGVGTNVQKRLVAKHDLDAPWRPADVEQRDGRIVRQGNQNEEVEIYRYVTEGSFDIYMWQTLERKASFIDQVMRGGGSREVEDIDGGALSYAEVKALATGNPLIMEKAEVDSTVQRLTKLKRQHDQDQWKIRSKRKNAEATATAAENEIRHIDETIAKRTETQGDAFAMDVDGEAFEERADAADALERTVMPKARSFIDEGRAFSDVIGKLGGFDLALTIDEKGFGSDEPIIDLSLDAPFAMQVRRVLSEFKASGAIRSLENALARLEKNKADAQEQMERARKEAEKAAALEGKPFAKQDDLDAAEKRQREIEDTFKEDEKKKTEGPVEGEGRESRYALRPPHAIAFTRALDRLKAGNMERGEVLPLGPTPPALRLAGLPNLPLVYKQTEALKNLDGKHKGLIDEGTLRRLPDLLADPIMVSKQENQRFAALIQDASGSDVLVVITPKAEIGRRPTNLVVTTHPKARADSILKDVAAGRIVYRHNEKSLDWLRKAQRQNAGDGSRQGFNENIPTEADIVNDPERRTEQRSKISDADRQKIARKVEQIARNLAPKASVATEDVVRSRSGDPVAGLYRGMDELIKVSLTIGDPEQTVRHEAIHALKDMGLFTNQEWAALEKEARRVWAERYEVDKYYPDLDKTARLEEAIAQAFAEWQGGKGKFRPAFRRVFDRMMKFFRRLANALRGLGYRTVDDVFEAVERGEVGKRPRVNTNSTAFRNWFKNSKAVNDDGSPMVLYHGTPSGTDIESFDPKKGERGNRAMYFTPDPNSAETYGMFQGAMRGKPGGGAVYPVYVTLQNPVMLDGAKGAFIPQYQVDAYKADGHDGAIFTNRLGQKEYIVFDPEQVKSAVGNKGAFDPSNPDIRYSRFWGSRANQVAKDTGTSVEAMKKAGGPLWQKPERVKGNAAQERAIAKIIAEEDNRSIGERIRDGIASFKEQGARKLRQGMFDQFDAIAHYEKSGNAGKLLDASASAYKAARLTQNLHSVMHVLLKRGMIGYQNGEFKRVDGFDGGFEAIFEGIAKKGLMKLWAAWAVANRSKRLKAEGRENLLDDADIDTLLALEKEYPEFRQALKKWERYNKAILDMAQDAGVIDPESRKVWEKNDYVPFYRVIEEDDTNTGPGNKKGIAGQRSGIKALKGGEAQINDLVENMVMNVTHLVDASFKNVAAKRTIREAARAGAVEAASMDWTVAHVTAGEASKKLSEIGVDIEEMPTAQKQQWLRMFTMRPPKQKDVVSVLVGGKPKYFQIHDPLLLSAMTHMNQQRFGWITENIFGGAKRLLTRGVTSFPDFMIANAIRDSMSAWVVTGGKTNPVAAMKGFVSSLKDTASRQAIAAAGGGTAGYYDVTPGDVRHQLNEEYREDAKGLALKAWEAWNAIGQASENMNRIAVFEKLKSEGATDAEAAFQAMDLMDFSMRGDWVAARWLATTVPFLNARLQGLYKLGRSYRANKIGFAVRGSVIAAATLAIAAANWDDDRYEELPEWDKDTYYHVWVGDTHIRIPKPFEVGAIFSTLPERLARFIGGKDDPEKFGEAIYRGFSDTFAFDPTPQLFRPLLEQYANKNFFTGSPIESFYQQDLLPGHRTRAGTSAMSRELGAAFPEAVSPVRLDALLRGYLGTLGTTIMMASNIVDEVISDTPTPTKRIDEIPVVRRFIKTDPPKYTRFIDDFYDMREEVTQIVRSAKRLAGEGNPEAAYKLLAENPKAAALYTLANRTGKRMADFSKMMQAVRADKTMRPDEKRRRLDEITVARNALARRAVEAARQ